MALARTNSTSSLKLDLDAEADEWTSKGYKQFLDITSVKGSSASYSTKPKRDALLFREALLRGLLFPFFPRWWRRSGQPEESQRRWALGSALFGVKASLKVRLFTQGSSAAPIADSGRPSMPTL